MVVTVPRHVVTAASVCVLQRILIKSVAFNAELSAQAFKEKAQLVETKIARLWSELKFFEFHIIGCRPDVSEALNLRLKPFGQSTLLQRA